MLEWRVVAGSREYWGVVGGCGVVCGVLGVWWDNGVFWLFWRGFWRYGRLWGNGANNACTSTATKTNTHCP